MAKLIGVTDILYSSEAKSLALLFDTLTHPFASYYKKGQGTGDAKLTAEVAWLFEKGIFTDFSDQAGFDPNELYFSLMLPLSQGASISEIERKLDSFVSVIDTWKSTTKMIPLQSDIPILVHPSGMAVLPSGKDSRLVVEKMLSLLSNTLSPTVRILATWLRKYRL